MTTSARRALVAALITAGLAATACGSSGTHGASAAQVDPRRYYEDYRSAPRGDALPSRSGVAATPVVALEAGAQPVIDVLDGNSFASPGIGPFVSTAEDPRSTFGLDVDTGAWSVGAAFLASGHLPAAESVRVEEYVNAFDYGYGEPDDDLGLSVDSGPMPLVADATHLVRIGVQGRTVSADERPDAVITLVVDISGSMDLQDRLGLVQASLAVMAQRLRPGDVVAVVTYGDTSSVLLPPTVVGNTAGILRAIDLLGPEGNTNMEAGLRLGYATARAAFVPGAANLVVLASDGVANVGATGPGSLVDLVRSSSQDGIRLVTVGYGLGNYNDVLMERLADQGDGFYAYVDSFAEAERLFGDELTTTLTVVAEEARAQVTFDPAMVAQYRLLGYENRAVADDAFEDLDVDTGEVGAGHAVTALYEVRLAEGVGAGRIGAVSVRWRSPAGTTRTLHHDIVVGAEADPDPDAGTSSFDLAALVGAYAEVVRASPWALERGVTLESVDRAVAALAPDPSVARLQATVAAALAATRLPS